MKALHHKICAAVDCTVRKHLILRQSKMCAVRLVNDERNAVRVYKLRYTRDVRYDTLVGRGGQQHRIHIRVLRKLFFNLLRCDRAGDPIRIDLRVHIMSGQLLHIDPMVYRLVAVARHQYAAPSAARGSDRREQTAGASVDQIICLSGTIQLCRTLLRVL